MTRRLMWIERKPGGGIVGPARIGWVETTKSGRSLRYNGRLFASLKGAGFKSNYRDEASGEEYWISGCRKDGRDALYTTEVEIDEDARAAYWTELRGQPEKLGTSRFRAMGKNR